MAMWTRSLTATAGAVVLCGLTVAGTDVSRAGEVKGVVELFTSQGCSSCPPADEVLAELAKRDDIVALGYHVDYWDYLGWKDSLGSPENTARQHAYARTLRSTSVYTPQAVLNGRSHANGSDRAAIETAATKPLLVPLDVKKSDRTVTISVPAADIGARDVHAILVRYGNAQTVSVQRGENRGRELHYANPVISIQTLAMWKGGAESFELPQDAVFGDKGDGCAVLLQVMGKDGAPGEIIGAANITQ